MDKCFLQSYQLAGGLPTQNYAREIDDTAFSDLITLKVGARVMLIYNVDVKDSLTNGQLRPIVGIISPDSSQINCVLVKFDDEHVGISLIKQ